MYNKDRVYVKLKKHSCVEFIKVGGKTMGQNIQEMNKRFEEKKREELLQSVPEKFHKRVIEALDYEKEEDYDKVEQICQEMLKEQNDREMEPVKIILARIYPRLLRKDVNDSNQMYQKDLEAYYTFLDSIQMNSLMQEYLVETLVRLCELMENPWYRPLFKEFVEHIEKKGYLTEEMYQKTLASAYASMESYSYYGDSKISIIVKTALKAGYDRAYVIPEEKMDSTRITMEIDALTNDWYICQYYEGHEDEFVYIEKEYPHSYALIKELIDAVKKEKEKKAEETVDALMQYVAEGTEKEQLKSLLQNSYNGVKEQKERPQMVHGGKGTYHRTVEKIGRNDLCPCGSGKKYKQCCGKE